MSGISSDLEQFLEVVAKVSAVEVESVGDAWDQIEGAGLPTLARDSADEPDALQWLAHTVRVAADSSPALAYVLAARYTADLAIADLSESTSSFALASDSSRPVVTTSPAPDVVVVLNVDQSSAAAVSWDLVSDSAQIEPRTGLSAARLASFSVPDSAAACPANVKLVMANWDLLTGAALVGIAERSARLTNAYVLQRRQFGAPIGSFAGLRSLVAGIQLRVDQTRALLDQAVEGSTPSESVAALAGQAAVASCLDAIQAHGGYGYITEYPVADMLRDAISLQARAGGRRLHVARVAARELGAPEDLSP